MKDKKFIFASVLVSAFLLTIGLTYAYFSLIASGNEEAEIINVETTKLELKYTDGKEINANGIEPGWTMTKTITIENKGNEETYYTLGWQKLYNEIQKEELVIRSTCTSTGVTGGTCSSTDKVVVPQTSEVTAETNKVIYPYKENVLILPGETHTYTVTIEFINYTDKHQNYNQGKRFYGVLGAAESTKKLPTLANYLIDNYSTLGLTKIDQTATGNQNYDTTEYRYQGNNSCNDFDMSEEICASMGGTFCGDPDIDWCYASGGSLIEITENICTANGGKWKNTGPNNYITFNGETGVWRIIGVFEVETPNGDGTYKRENKVKIVRDTIGTVAWNIENKNDWTTATLMTMLNSGPYYNRTSGYTDLACSATFYGTAESQTTKCNYTTNGLTTTAKRQISPTKWYLGNVTYGEVGKGIQGTYQEERSTAVLSGNKQTWDGKVALIYPSDYMYASSVCYNDPTKDVWNDVNMTCSTSNWLYAGWMLTLSPYYLIDNDEYSAITTRPIYFDAGDTRNIFLAGASSPITKEIKGLRQSVYLDTNVSYISGSGTTSDPFIIK